MRERRNEMTEFGKPLRVEISEEPGLHDLLEEGAPPDDRDLERAVDEFMLSRGVEDTPVGEGLGDAIRVHSEATEEGIGGLWRALRAWLAGEQHKVVGIEQQSLDIGSYWLTVPDIAGAKVSLTSSVSSSRETSGAVTIAGIGGGPTLKIAIKEDVAFNDVTENERVDVSAIGTFEEIQVTKDGQVVTTYARLKAVDGDHIVFTPHPAAPPDPGPWGRPTKSERYDVREGTGTVKLVLTVDRGTTWEIGAELSVPNLGLKAKLDAKMTYEREVSFAYEFPRGQDVIAARYLSSFRRTYGRWSRESRSEQLQCSSEPDAGRRTPSRTSACAPPARSHRSDPRRPRPLPFTRQPESA
jgi:hypothetical protein